MDLFVCETCTVHEPADEPGWSAHPTHTGHRGLVIRGEDYDELIRTAVRHLQIIGRVPRYGPMGDFATLADWFSSDDTVYDGL